MVDGAGNRLAGRMQELAEFVGLDQEGLELIRSTRDLILAHGDDLTASVYDNFLDFPETRRFFTDEHGEVNEDRPHPAQAQPDEMASRLGGLPDGFGLSHPGLGHGNRPQPPATAPRPPRFCALEVHG